MKTNTGLQRNFFKKIENGVKSVKCDKNVML